MVSGENKRNTVYLDTSVLANWLLLYRKSKRTRRLAEKKAKESMRLLDRILKGRYSCRFLISPYVMSELSQSARDNLVALKMIRDGQSLVWFNRLKKQYRLKNWEQADIRRSIDSFAKFLLNKKFILFDAHIDSDDIHRFSLRYSLETHDAIHLSIARRNAAYLVTTDSDLLESKPRIKEMAVVRPAALETLTTLRKEP